MKRILQILIPLVLMLNMALPAQSQLRISVEDGLREPLPIAFAPFIAKSGASAGMGQNLADVAIADLESSRLFRAIDPAAFIQTPAAAAIAPRFSDWRQINAQALITGTVGGEPDGRIRVEFRLWDVLGESQLVGQAYVTQKENWRRVSHLVADTIYKWLTGEKGYFDTRVVYVAESGAADRKIKRLAIMDQDGANHSYLTSGRNLVLTPRFSPSRQEITYMSYAGRRPRVRILNVDTNQDETLGPIDGMTFAPRFSPDGEKLLFSAEQRGNSDVFVLDLRSRKRVRLTNHPAIDTSPSFSPNQREVVFNSDRGGSPQLYVMASDGANARRISFGGGRYATPVWSPRGDLIAFTKIEGGRFGIGVMRSDGSNERMLSQSYFEESPTWAPNGRVIMFFRRTPTDRQGRGGKSRLFIVDVAGGEPREIKTPGDASDPAWSPLSP
ncbi:MAG: Tol-Pal system beta propeller repeat protein TolB [Rhodospirillales bacterium]|jgi:TolB protein